MQQLLNLLSLGVATTLLDVDNAMYMTSAVDQLPPEDQRRAIFWGLVIEFFARIGLVLIFAYLLSGTKPLFEIFGIEFTVESISLLAAGLFLLIRSARELISFLRGVDEDEPKPDSEQVQQKSFSRVMLEMAPVSALLSVDTVIAVAGRATTSGAQFALVVYLFLFSAGVRLVFVRQIATYMKRYPATNIIVLAFLILIGIELTAQGLGVEVPERLFNGGILIALIGAIIYQWRFTQPAPAEPEQPMAETDELAP